MPRKSDRPRRVRTSGIRAAPRCGPARASRRRGRNQGRRTQTGAWRCSLLACGAAASLLGVPLRGTRTRRSANTGQSGDARQHPEPGGQKKKQNFKFFHSHESHGRYPLRVVIHSSHYQPGDLIAACPPSMSSLSGGTGRAWFRLPCGPSLPTLAGASANGSGPESVRLCLMQRRYLRMM
jgi:hypothetical protein